MAPVKGILTEDVLDHGFELSEGLTLSNKIMYHSWGSNWMLHIGIKL
ncbi:hypothetical protein PMIT1313_01732 [Prochlorococcus marinus str. MIT 1313]|nr:hypothetical protein PMIT1313_01732 [Prochlorococcus marinus str. MIT 1313]